MTTDTQTRTDDVAVTVRFGVTVDDNSLGTFNSCEGLGFEIVMEQREEGGNNGLVWQLPSRIKYSNVKFTRPIGSDSYALTTWIAKAVRSFEPTTAVIQAMTAEGTVIAQWELQGVVPVRWTGPSLNPETAKVATETLELAHHGIDSIQQV